MSTNLDLTTGSITKKLIIFALPHFLTMLLQQLYNIVDMVVVGRFIGSAGVVALSNASPIIWLTNSVGYGLSVGGSVLISQYKGSNDIKSQNETIGTLFVSVAIVFGIIASILTVIFSGSIFKWMNIPAESFQYARDYMIVIGTGYVFMFGYNAICAVMRGFGNSKYPLYFVILSTILNILFNLIFVGSLKMGTIGSALATLISQIAAFTVSLIYLKILYFKDKPMPLFMAKWRKFLGLLKIGLPVVGQETIFSFSFSVITIMINAFGVLDAAAAGIGMRIIAFLCTPYWAIGDGVCVMVGQNLGAKKLERTKRAGLTGWKITLLTSLFLTILLQIFAQPLVSLFDSNPEVIAKGTLYLRIFALDGVFYATMFNFDMFAIGVGHSLLGFANSFIDSILMRIFLCWLLAFGLGYGFMGLCIGQALSSVIPGIIGLIYFQSGIWKRQFLNKKNKNINSV